MDTQSPPDHPDPTLLLPRDAYWHLIRTLRTSLPAPVIDTPGDLACRDHAAIAQVSALLPANAAEATLAAQYVAANAQAMDCLRLAQAPALPLVLALKCHARSASMMRQSQGALRLLLRVQAERRKLEADAVATDRAAWTEHCAAALMMQALAGAPSEAVVLPPPPSPAPAPEPKAEPVPDPLADAEQYALIYPRRAALIRQLGRLPDNPSFGPPEEDLVRALVTGRTPVLLALDAAGAG